MKKLLLSLLLAGGVQNSLAMQGGETKNGSYFKFLATVPQLAFNTLKNHPKASAATGFVASACAAYYLYNKFNKSSLSQQPGVDLKNGIASAACGVQNSFAMQGGAARSASANAVVDNLSPAA